MADNKRTSEYRKLLPFIARASGDVGDDTIGEDVQALLQALNTHKTSSDHDGRYYTESEMDSALGLKANKAVTLAAGSGLTGGGDLSEDRTFNVGAENGIIVTDDAVGVDMATNFIWSGIHTFNSAVIINGPFALGSDQLMVNNNGDDVDVELQLYRTTGGPFSLFWNGDVGWTTKPFRPQDLLINRISDTEPSNPKAGMVWVDPND